MPNILKSKMVAVIAFWLLAAVLISLRRPDQVLRPEVWIEDGTTIVPTLIKSGWEAVFSSANSYFIIPAKLLSAISLTLSFDYYPEISTVLGIFVQSGCLAIIAFAPTTLPFPVHFALATIFVPSDSEVFGVHQYVIWWISLLTIPALLWKEEAPQWPRHLIMIASGFSSPFVVFMSPLFVVEAWLNKSRSSIAITVTALILAAIQFSYSAKIGGTADNVVYNLRAPLHLVSVYFGFFFKPLFHSSQVLPALAVVATLMIGLFTLPEREQRNYLLLGFCLSVSIFIPIARLRGSPNPFDAGPRYFFYPLTILSWMLIWLVRRSTISVRGFSIFVLVMMAITTASHFQRFQVALTPWRLQIAECLEGKRTTFDIQYDGEGRDSWHTEMNTADCEKARRSSLLDRGQLSR